MSKSRNRPGARRSVRLAPLIREVLSEELLCRARDSILADSVVTDVEVSGDCRIATAYVVTLSEETPREELIEAFQRSAGYLRKVLGAALHIRHTPELRFKLDEGVARGRRIDQLLASVRGERDSGLSEEKDAPPPDLTD